MDAIRTYHPKWIFRIFQFAHLILRVFFLRPYWVECDDECEAERVHKTLYNHQNKTPLSPDNRVYKWCMRKVHRKRCRFCHLNNREKKRKKGKGNPFGIRKSSRFEMRRQRHAKYDPIGIFICHSNELSIHRISIRVQFLIDSNFPFILE